MGKPVGAAAGEEGKATDEFGTLVATPAYPGRGVSATAHLLALGRAATEALAGTIGLVPEVHTVLFAIEGQHIRVVTAVMEYSDDTLERVAEKELELMDALPEYLLEFRVVPVERLGSYLRAGYLAVLERQTERT
ncbi:MAG: hypothetical protein FJ291_31560 [Planctomycetes bacterium]|nr:hypothetical protein [Planctomycetota bacterium]